MDLQTLEYRRVTLEYRRVTSEHAQHAVARVANLIPDNWLCLSGNLHASSYMIEQGLVEFGTLLTLRGKTPKDKRLGMGSTNYEINYCPNVTSCPSLTGKTPEIQNPMKVAIDGKSPCGISFLAAGALTGEKSLAEMKRALYLKLREGYWGESIIAISGSQVRLERETTITRGDQLLSKFYAPLAMDINVAMNGNALVALSWNPELGGHREQLSEIEKGLLGLDFKL